MGDNYLQAQANYATQRRCKERSEMVQQPSLPFKAVQLQTIYHLDSLPGEVIKEGDTLRAIRNADGSVGILKGHRAVASISGEGEQVLGKILAQATAMTLIVIEVDGQSQTVLCSAQRDSFR